MYHWGVSPCWINPPVAKAHHRNDTNAPRNVNASYPHPPNPPRSSGVTIVGPTTAIATHTTSQNHCAQEGRDTIDTCCAPGPRHRDGVDMPDAGLHPHREAMHKQHTQSGSSCCVPFGDPQVNKATRSENQTGMQPQKRKHIGASPPSGEDTTDRRQVQRKEWQHEVRQGDTHDSGFAAIRVSPCQTSNANFAMVQ